MLDFFTYLHTGISNTMAVEIWKNFRRRAGEQVKLGHYNFSPCQTDRMCGTIACT